VQINSSFRVEVRDSYIHQGSWPEPSGGGYAISVANGSSEALIENNIMTDANKVMVFRSAGTGSVVGYNYTDDGWIWGTQGWVEVAINASHMAGPHHVLYEGNYSFTPIAIIRTAIERGSARAPCRTLTRRFTPRSKPGGTGLSRASIPTSTSTGS
jgi:hypothetical protein